MQSIYASVLLMDKQKSQKGSLGCTKDKSTSCKETMLSLRRSWLLYKNGKRSPGRVAGFQWVWGRRSWKRSPKTTIVTTWTRCLKVVWWQGTLVYCPSQWSLREIDSVQHSPQILRVSLGLLQNKNIKTERLLPTISTSLKLLLKKAAQVHSSAKLSS